tara:strand:+ start:1766 stop:2533 length:768 start_codon:yes stop_codon:yes gene_type:complete
MAVSGKELATLDFANLIGGPLNAIVEAQAKSAISTANFIKQVGFKEDGSVVTTDFSITKTNNEGRKQDFKLSVPFLTMLPIPYIKIDEAIVEFNAKITSTTESSSDSAFKQEIDASAGGRYWFVSAKISSKTSYQKKSANSDKEERTFDMHVKVTASNTDMPAGTEKILNILEESMHETAGAIKSEALTIGDIVENSTYTYNVILGDISRLKDGDKVSPEDDIKKADNVVTSVDIAAKTITFQDDVTTGSNLFVF